MLTPHRPIAPLQAVLTALLTDPSSCPATMISMMQAAYLQALQDSVLHPDDSADLTDQWEAWQILADTDRDLFRRIDLNARQQWRRDQFCSQVTTLTHTID